VILINIRMPGLDGVGATREIVAAHPEGDGPKVVMLTTLDLDEYVLGALQAGASGFLLKDATPDVIIDGVRIAASGAAMLAPTVTRRLIDRITTRPEIASMVPRLHADMLQLPLRDSCCALVVAYYSIQHLPQMALHHRVALTTRPHRRGRPAQRAAPC